MQCATHWWAWHSSSVQTGFGSIWQPWPQHCLPSTSSERLQRRSPRARHSPARDSHSLDTSRSLAGCQHPSPLYHAIYREKRGISEQARKPLTRHWPCTLALFHMQCAPLAAACVSRSPRLPVRVSGSISSTVHDIPAFQACVSVSTWHTEMHLGRLGIAMPQQRMAAKSCAGWQVGSALPTANRPGQPGCTIRGGGDAPQRAMQSARHAEPEERPACWLRSLSCFPTPFSPMPLSLGCLRASLSQPRKSRHSV